MGTFQRRDYGQHKKRFLEVLILVRFEKILDYSAETRHHRRALSIPDRFDGPVFVFFTTHDFKYVHDRVKSLVFQRIQ